MSSEDVKAAKKENGVALRCHVSSSESEVGRETSIPLSLATARQVQEWRSERFYEGEACVRSKVWRTLLRTHNAVKDVFAISYYTWYARQAEVRQAINLVFAKHQG